METKAISVFVMEVEIEKIQALQKELGLPDAKTLFNVSLALMQKVSEDIKKGRFIASIERSTMAYKELDIETLLRSSSPPPC